MNNLSRDDFKIQAFKTLASVVGKCYENNFYREINFKINKNCAWADFIGKPGIFSIHINSNQIKIKFIFCKLINKSFTYYEYSENDDHYEVLNKFKNDMIKNLRQCRKVKDHLTNYKIYLYDTEYKNYENKYYTPGGMKND